MKITSEKQTPEFIPTKIIFEFQTQKELDLFGAFFNTSAITEALDEVGGQELGYIYEAFELAGANCDTLQPKIYDTLKRNFKK